MAGLSHNPKATYCTKAGELSDPEAVCDYCSARGLGPQPAVADDVVEPEAEITAEELLGLFPRASEPAPIVRFFEKIGVSKGESIWNVRLVNGAILPGEYKIVDMAGYEDKAVVLTLQEPGISQRVRVVWDKVVSWTL